MLGTGVALVGGIVTYGAWRHTTALAARIPMGAVAAHPDAAPDSSRPRPSPPTNPAYGDIADAPDPADPGRLLLGPLHRHAAVGFHLDAVYTALFVRPVAGRRLARPFPRPRGRRHLRTRRGRPTPAGSAPPYAAPRPATCRPM